MSSKFQNVKRFFDIIKNTKGFDRNLTQVKLLSCDNGRCSCEYKVEEAVLNKYGTMHGGFTATIVDVVTTFVLVSENPGNPGVSVNLNVNYLRPAQVGSNLVFDASLTKKGKQMAFMEIAIKEKESGKVIATGSHTKYIAGNANL